MRIFLSPHAIFSALPFVQENISGISRNCYFPFSRINLSQVLGDGVPRSCWVRKIQLSRVTVSGYSCVPCGTPVPGNTGFLLPQRSDDFSPVPGDTDLVHFQVDIITDLVEKRPFRATLVC